jgi:glycosyltransferase involved in cell wall biosynthesis
LDAKRHIAIFASWYPTREQGLNGNFIQDFAHLLGTRYQVSVIHVGAQDGTQNPLVRVSCEGSVRVYQAELPHKKGISGFLFYQVHWWKQIRKFWKQMCSEEGTPDIIQVQVVWKMGIAAVWYAWRAKIPFIVHEHWTGYYPADPQLKGLRWLWHHLILRRAKAVSAVSKPLALALEALGARKPVAVLMNAVTYTAARADRSKFPHFLHVSNFREEHKQTHSVLMVFQKVQKEFPEARLTLVGNAPEDLRRAYTTAPGVAFSGPLTRQELGKLYAEATAVVSFSRFETFALSIAEGLLHGTPAIYTACGGPETYMQPHWGLRADADDPHTLYLCMHEFCSGSKNWNHAQIAAEAQQKFSQKALLDTFDSWLNRLI